MLDDNSVVAPVGSSAPLPAQAASPLPIARWVIYGMAGIIGLPIAGLLFVVCLIVAAPIVILAWVLQLVLSDSLNALVDFADLLASFRWRLARAARSCQSPRTQDFMLGLPAVAVLAAAILPCCLALCLPDRLDQRYRTATLDALERGDSKAASVYRQRLSATPEDRLLLAHTAAALGDQGHCRDLMASLAAASGEPAGIANTWLAEQLLKDAAANTHSQVAACRHLERAAQEFPGDGQLHRRLGELYLRLGHLNAATNHLALAVRIDPSLALLVARLYMTQGHRAEGEWLAQQSLSYWSSRVHADPRDSHARRSLAGAELLLGHHQRAVDCLAEAPEHDAQLSAALAEAYVAWADELRSENAEPGPIARLLAAALASDPYRLTVIKRIARWRHLHGPGAAEIERLFSNLDLDHAPAAVFVVLAGVSTDEGNDAGARRQLERALAIDSRCVAAANNLALLLVRDHPRHWRRALDLVSAALSTADTDQAELYDTRATILSKLGQPIPSLVDLGRALELRPTDRSLWARFMPALSSSIARISAGRL